MFPYDGIPIRITTKSYQRRSHRKKRINKKWRKRYGYKEWDPLTDGQMVFVDGILYMTRKDYEMLKGGC